MSCNLWSFNITSCKVISCYVKSCYVMSCKVMSCNLMQCKISQYNAIQFNAMSISWHFCSFHPGDSLQLGMNQTTTVRWHNVMHVHYSAFVYLYLSAIHQESANLCFWFVLASFLDLLSSFFTSVLWLLEVLGVTDRASSDLSCQFHKITAKIVYMKLF